MASSSRRVLVNGRPLDYFPFSARVSARMARPDYRPAPPVPAPKALSYPYTYPEYEEMFAKELKVLRQEAKERKGQKPTHPQPSSTIPNPSGPDSGIEAQPVFGEADEALFVGVAQTSKAEEKPRSAPVTQTGKKPKRVPLKRKAKPKTKGEVREVGGGSIEFYDEDTRSWRPAVRHDDIRGALTEEASQIGKYDYPRERGEADDDITSYLPKQKEWGPDREQNWPDILHRFERRDLPAPEYDVGYLIHDGKIVLDQDNRPVLDFEDLPATLSAELSGQHMEAIARLDPRISHRDFLARMPKERRIRRNGQTIIKPSYSLSAIGMRVSRFRQENGLLSWNKREGSQNINQHLINRLPLENYEANSTRGIPPPGLLEQSKARQKNKAQHLARAGQRALSESERQKRQAKEDERLARLRAAEAEAKEPKIGEQDQEQDRVMDPLAQEHGQVRNGNRRKRTRDASADNDEEAQPVNKRKRNKIDHPMLITSQVSEIPPTPPTPPTEPNEAPEASRKRSREESDYDELPDPKRQVTGSAPVSREKILDADQEPQWEATWDADIQVFNELPVDPMLSMDLAQFIDPVFPEDRVVPGVMNAPGAPIAPQAVMVPQPTTVSSISPLSQVPTVPQAPTPPPPPQAPMIQEPLPAPRPPVIRRVTSAQSQKSRKAKPMGKKPTKGLTSHRSTEK